MVRGERAFCGQLFRGPCQDILGDVPSNYSVLLHLLGPSVLVGVRCQIFFQGGWGSYKLKCPTCFNIPSTSPEKNFIYHGWGGARLLWLVVQGPLPRHLGRQSFQLLNPVASARTLCAGGGGISIFFQEGWGVLQVGRSKLQVGMSKLIQHTNHLPEKKLDKS